jgi:hypothetical protein
MMMIINIINEINNYNFLSKKHNLDPGAYEIYTGKAADPTPEKPHLKLNRPQVLEFPRKNGTEKK